VSAKKRKPAAARIRLLPLPLSGCHLSAQFFEQTHQVVGVLFLFRKNLLHEPP
jgi:hypothetical protein